MQHTEVLTAAISTNQLVETAHDTGACLQHISLGAVQRSHPEDTATDYTLCLLRQSIAEFRNMVSHRNAPFSCLCCLREMGCNTLPTAVSKEDCPYGSCKANGTEER